MSLTSAGASERAGFIEAPQMGPANMDFQRDDRANGDSGGDALFPRAVETLR